MCGRDPRAITCSRGLKALDSRSDLGLQNAFLTTSNVIKTEQGVRDALIRPCLWKGDDGHWRFFSLEHTSGLIGSALCSTKTTRPAATASNAETFSRKQVSLACWTLGYGLNLTRHYVSGMNCHIAMLKEQVHKEIVCTRYLNAD
jgi:hypothetical protein